jgi:4-hydroxy-2-oxoheptanedioate aldolase
MRANGVRDAWADDRAALGAWLTIPSGFSAEIMAHAGFDWVCVDMQHTSGIAAPRDRRERG